MRSVRCDVCGAKALVAASKCPKCSHAFEVRDGFGELLPLSHCPTCDSYYPQSVGACRWCGTKPERMAPITPYVWKALGVLTFFALGVGAWLVRDDTPREKATPPRTFVADTLPTNQPKPESFGKYKTLAQGDSGIAVARDSTATATPGDSTREVAGVVASGDTTQSASTTVVATERVSLQSAGTVVVPEPVPVVDSAPAVADPSPPPVPRARAAEKAPPRTVARTPEKTPPRTLARTPERASVRPPVRAPARATAKAPPRVASTPKATTRGRTSSRWVSSVARNWAVVRADPSRQSRIIASIGPNTRVQLGETRGAWRRIKAKGLAGWVEHRTLVARLPAARRAGRLASRN